MAMGYGRLERAQSRSSKSTAKASVSRPQTALADRIENMPRRTSECQVFGEETEALVGPTRPVPISDIG